MDPDDRLPVRDPVNRARYTRDLASLTFMGVSLAGLVVVAFLTAPLLGAAASFAALGVLGGVLGLDNR